MQTNTKSIIAITGPSGVGKTTLANNLSSRLNLFIPMHCTTRQKRDDDKEGFYRYLTHDEYELLLKKNEFLISSGDGPFVKKEFGNFYGVLLQDCVDAWKKNDVIIIFASYKDIYRLVSLNENGIKIDIINLKFNNIENGVKYRLNNCKTRNHTPSDIENRSKCAILDNEKFGQAVENYSKCTLYTDVLNAEETYEKVCFKLRIKNK